MQAGEAILIVNSDAAARARLQSILAGLGYTVETADSFTAAVAALASGQWTLVLCACALSDGSGLTLIKAANQLTIGTTVILLGDRRQATALAALRGGAADYLPLPIDAAELAAAIERALGHRAAHAVGEPHAPATGAEIQLWQAPGADAHRQCNLAAQHQFARALAHEINNPLTPIIGLADLLLEDLPPGHPGRAYATVISAAAWRIHDVVRSLSAMAEDRERGESR